jgi:hypothetical protein
MSKEESLKLLTIAAKYYNNKDTQMNTPALNEEQIEAGYISTTKYTKAPTFPKELESLSKEYTYEDLQERAKRMLDSLYIKDGWDE